MFKKATEADSLAKNETSGNSEFVTGVALLRTLLLKSFLESGMNLNFKKSLDVVQV